MPCSNAKFKLPSPQCSPSLRCQCPCLNSCIFKRLTQLIPCLRRAHASPGTDIPKLTTVLLGVPRGMQVAGLWLELRKRRWQVPPRCSHAPSAQGLSMGAAQDAQPLATQEHDKAAGDTTSDAGQRLTECWQQAPLRVASQEQHWRSAAL